MASVFALITRGTCPSATCSPRLTYRTLVLSNRLLFSVLAQSQQSQLANPPTDHKKTPLKATKLSTGGPKTCTARTARPVSSHYSHCQVAQIRPFQDWDSSSANPPSVSRLSPFQSLSSPLLIHPLPTFSHAKHIASFALSFLTRPAAPVRITSRVLRQSSTSPLFAACCGPKRIIPHRAQSPNRHRSLSQTSNALTGQDRSSNQRPRKIRLRQKIIPHRTYNLDTNPSLVSGTSVFLFCGFVFLLAAGEVVYLRHYRQQHPTRAIISSVTPTCQTISSISSAAQTRFYCVS